MTLDAPTRLITWAGLILVSLIIAGCDGDDGSGPPTNAPVISNLAVTSLGTSCTVSGASGRQFRHTFEYTDLNGDVRGGTLESTATPCCVGAPITNTVAVPSSLATITGTEAGTVTFNTCTRFGGNSSFTRSVVLVDVAGNRSNTLSLEVGRPAGAPEVRQSVEHDAFEEIPAPAN